MNTERAPMPLRPASRLTGLRPYVPASAGPDDVLRLDANEGAPRSESNAPSRVDVAALCRYPDAAPLERQIAERWRVEPPRVVVTSGGDDAIDRVCRAVLEPGTEALLHTPTFVMIERGVVLAGGALRRVPWIDGDFPAERFIATIGERTRLVSLVSPNNPTGGVIALEQIRAIADAAARYGALVMVDLAYAEFADADPTAELLSLPNAVVVRTFSKAMGLAGLRVGYAIAPPEVARWLRTAGSPYPVSSVSLSIASDALDRERDRDGSVRRVRDERAEITTLLHNLGATPLASQANFVTARFRDAAFVQRALASLGVSVRCFGAGSDIDECLRITMPGDSRGFARLKSALATSLAPQALLLDLDGVLADVSLSYRRAIVETARSFGVSTSDAEVTALKLDGNANNDWALTQRILAHNGTNVAFDAVVDRFQSLYLGTDTAAGLRERETLIPSRAMLERLAERFALAIVTGRPRDEAEWFLDRFGLRELFKAVVCMEDAPPKPSPEPVRLALQRLGAPSAWLIGDTPDDLTASRHAGAVPIGVCAPRDDQEPACTALLDAGAARVVRNLDTLWELLP